MEYVCVGVIVAFILAAVFPSDDDGYRNSNNGIGVDDD